MLIDLEKVSIGLIKKPLTGLTRLTGLMRIDVIFIIP
jgi:hypothetical protein